MYKLITIDLDGTLLNSYGQVSKENSEKIKKAMQCGIEVVLASGRNPMSVKTLANEIGCDKYMICGNGAILYDIKENRILYEKYLKKEKVLSLIKICEENSIYYSISTEDRMLTKSLNYNVLFYNYENNKKTDDKKTKIEIIDDMYKYVEEREKVDYIKINICDDSNVIFNSIIKKLKKIKDIDVLDVAHMSRKIIKTGTEENKIEYYYTEITKKNVNKWSAIEYLIKILKITAKEVIAIGDNINDKTMIEGAGLGVAMENSAPYIKEMADEITLDNNSNGVAKIIEKYILKNE